MKAEDNQLQPVVRMRTEKAKVHYEILSADRKKVLFTHTPKGEDKIELTNENSTYTTPEILRAYKNGGKVGDKKREISIEGHAPVNLSRSEKDPTNVKNVKVVASPAHYEAYGLPLRRVENSNASKDQPFYRSYDVSIDNFPHQRYPSKGSPAYSRIIDYATTESVLKAEDRARLLGTIRFFVHRSHRPTEENGRKIIPQSPSYNEQNVKQADDLLNEAKKVLAR